MKITTKQYAISLYESVEGRPAAQVKAIIKNFVEFLAGKNQLAKSEKIIKEFTKIWNDKHGIIEAEILSANGLDKETAKLLKKYIIKLSGAKEATVKERQDKNILGGVVIKYGDKVLDGSLRTSLVDLKNKMIK